MFNNSYRFGRKNLFIWGLFGCGVTGIIKSFAISYPMFLILEFLDAYIGSGTFMGGFVLAMELVGPRQRTLGGTFIMCWYTAGVIMLGTYASWATDFRKLLRLCYTPALFVLSLFWLIPESSRWLMISGRRREAADIVMKAAKTNGVRLKEDTLQRLHDHCNEDVYQLDGNSLDPKEKPSEDISLFTSRALVMRTLSCCFCWLVNAFVAYGLTLNSVDLSGSKYTNFILMTVVEIPAYIASYFLTTHVGRRWSLCGMMLLAGCSCLGTLFIPTTGGHTSGIAFRLPFFLVGKFAITASFNVLYVYTTEIFPTGVRNGMMSTCSMIGRLGSMLAPQTPLLVKQISTLNVN